MHRSPILEIGARDACAVSRPLSGVPLPQGGVLRSEATRRGGSDPALTRMGQDPLRLAVLGTSP